MHTTCAAAFGPKAWTCATAPRKPRCPSCYVCGITSPGAALCTARQKDNRDESARQGLAKVVGYDRLTLSRKL